MQNIALSLSDAIHLTSIRAIAMYVSIFEDFQNRTLYIIEVTTLLSGANFMNCFESTESS